GPAPADLGRPISSHVAFEQARAAFGMDDLQISGRGADEQAAIFFDADDGWSESGTEGVGDQARAILGHVGGGGVRRAQVDADDAVHGCGSGVCGRQAGSVLSRLPGWIASGFEDPPAAAAAGSFPIYRHRFSGKVTPCFAAVSWLLR